VKRVLLVVILTGMMLTSSMLGVANTRAQSSVFGTVYIRADGTVDPSTAPIQRNGNVYNLTADLQFNDTNGGLVVQRDNVIVDGGGHALELFDNPDVGAEITLSQINNVTITKVSSQTVFLDNSSNCSILDSSILLGFTTSWSVIMSSSNNNSILRNVMDTIALDNSSNNDVALNTMTGGGQSGSGVTFSLATSDDNTIFQNIINYAENLYPSPSSLLNFSSSSDNLIYHNTLSFPYWWYKTYSPGSPVVVVQSDNLTNAWDNGYPSGGNYWAGVNFTDTYSGPYQNESGSDGIADTPYFLAPNNIDNYPLMKPVTIPFEDIAIIDVQPRQTLIPAGNLASFNVSVNNQGGYAATWSLTLNIEYAYVPAERDFTLQADAVRGWNQTMPGPTITVIEGDTVNLSLEAADNLNHQFYVDYNNNSVPDDEEPVSPSFNTSTTFNFTASVVGNFTYYDADHQDTTYGLFQVLPLPTQSSQAGPNSIYLESNQNATLTFVWNTTGFMYGEYTISAYAKPALRETDITDNILSGGLVNVTIPGDLTSGYQVTSLDIGIITSAFGSKLGEAKWNPNADLNNDGIVNMKDIAILARHYGQPYPWPLGPPPPPTSPPSGP
jgi:hypothetical protein